MGGARVSCASNGIKGQVTRNLDEERKRKKLLLFPIRIDDTVLETNEAWARLLRGLEVEADSAHRSACPGL
jgi:hypothetical protein